MKPCVFCGGNASREAYVNPKVKSWVLKPSQLYLMCESCYPLNEVGNDDSLIAIIYSKWDKIVDSRKEAKNLSKMARNRFKGYPKGEIHDS